MEAKRPIIRMVSSEKGFCGLLFVGGIIAHILYLVVLLHVVPFDSWNWAHADTETYIGPARAFLQTGVFARNGAPDYQRTIGYPLFLAGALRMGEMSGVDWRIIVYVAQAVILALIYPVIYYLGRDVFGLTRRASAYCVGFTVLSGAFISYTTVILSDACFAIALMLGIACGFYALKRRSIGWGLLHVAALTYAAAVRPMLAFYPFAAAGMHWAYIKNRYRNPDRFLYILISMMFLLALVGAQSPSLRNWSNYRVFTPSEFGSMNLYECLAKDVLESRNQNERYDQVAMALAELSDNARIHDRIALREKEAMRVYVDYPITTAFFVAFNTVLNSVEMHWNNTLFYLLRRTWYRDYEDGSVRWSPLTFMTAVLFVMIYGCIYAVAIVQLLAMRKNMCLIGSILLFLLPFVFCATTYQGARFRLWFEPFIVLAAALTIQQVHARMLRLSEYAQGGFTLGARRK